MDIRMYRKEGKRMAYGSLMEGMKRIVYEAGALIKDRAGQGSVCAKEGHANYVTEYDVKVQEFLADKFSTLLPEAAFIGEENSEKNLDVKQGYAFIVDPIDGTNNFICDFYFSAICAALSLNGTVIMGCVYNPFREEMFWAEQGRGAYLNDKRIHVRNGTLAEGVVIFDGAPYYPEMREAVMELAEELSYRTMDLRTLGSAALSLCYVACGRGVAYECPILRAWDYAAASIIISEAGGIICGFDGRKLEIENTVDVAAGSCESIKEMLPILRRYIEEKKF